MRDFLKKLLPIIVLAVLASCNNTQESKDDVLWYRQAAANWNEAMPLGNGRIGVMVFGDPSKERIQLNDDSLWPNDAGWEITDGNREDLEEIRQLLKEGKNAEADKMVVNKYSRKAVTRSHQTMGDLYLELGHENISDYKRELNLSKAIANISYRSNGNLVSEKVFVSHPHRAIVIELTTEAEEGLNGKIRMSRPKDKGHETATTSVNDNGLLVMNGEITQYGGKFDSKPFPITEGVKFETCLQLDNQGGEIIKGEDYLELLNVKKATFVLVSNSSFYHQDYQNKNIEDLRTLQGIDINTIEKKHIEDFRSYYSKLELSLADGSYDSLATDVRLQRIKDGETDPGLSELLFKYGRYLLISSSRPGTNPANLQGLWNEHIKAPWNADYHLNINLQMNYWLADVTNLGELNEPLFDYVDILVESGKETANKNFGCRGSFMPHATDFWAPTWMRSATAYWGASMGAGGWMMQHYWQHFLFTGDTVFLKDRAYPAIKEVAQFYSDWLIEDPRDHSLISSPSTSPENSFVDENGERVATCLGSAMDQQVIEEVFNNYLEACRILNIKDSLSETITSQLAKLRPGFVIGSDGRILEWDREYKEFEPGHRHMSHLYGFHPGTAVSVDENPDIFNAVRKTLDYRLENGGAGTGWSRAWLINCSARLLDGEMANEHIDMMFKKSISTNLFDMHPPFQIDGNFGFTAGIAEMLLQSHENNKLRILPALPESWKKGHVKGIKARGNMELDIYWENSELTKVVIKAGQDNQFNLVYKNQIVPVSLKKGESYTYNHKTL